MDRRFNYLRGHGQRANRRHSGAMTQSDPGVFGTVLRRNRAGRRMSQLDLALTCGVSARHLSFLESGRAQPSRDMVLQLAAGLILPLQARNMLLQAAGFAPVFPASPLESDALGPFRAILSEMMARHAPNPAILCDRTWTVRDANPAARALLAAMSDGGELNLIRMLCDTPRVAPVIANLPEVLEEMRSRVELEALEAGDDAEIAALLRLLDAASARHPPAHARQQRNPVVPIVLNHPGGALRFLSAIAHFGTSQDVTVRDLRLELLFPADEHTRAAMAAFAQ